MNTSFLEKKLAERAANHALRYLRQQQGMVDFCSNDYLGIAANGLIEKSAYYHEQLATYKHHLHGSTGSRLLAGNNAFTEWVEMQIALFHDASAALIFNSGYDANIGLLSAVPQKGDTIFYDQLVHASIRDGIRLSFATTYAFAHNNLDDLLKKMDHATGNIFIVTESVFSMDGDTAPLAALVDLCQQRNAHLIVDEAHAFGVLGEKGEGICQSLGIHERCFARIYTYGKAAGAHGAAIVGSQMLIQYLINFARSFIYTTALPATSIAAIGAAYQLIPTLSKEREFLIQYATVFQEATLQYQKLISFTPIQAVIVPGNREVKKLAEQMQQAGLDVRPILYPTVPKGVERIRIVLHAFNTTSHMEQLLNGLKVGKQ